MNAVTTPSQPLSASFVKRLLSRYPLAGYFTLTFAGAWLALLPLLLDTHGIGLVPITLPDVVFFILAGLAGPTLAAFVMTAVTGGKAGVRQLLRRYVLWRVGIQWYLLVLLGPPLVLLLGETVFLGATPWNALIVKWPEIFTSYLPLLGIIVVFAQLLEEPGWTGFAVPRLQQKYGPLLGACILGVFWALWHLPTMFINSDIGSGRVPLPEVLPSMGRLMLLAVISRIIWTWVFNNTKGSILIAILLHAASDAAISLVFLQIIGYPILFGGRHVSGWFDAFYGVWDVRITYAVCALIILVCTRGYLSYKRYRGAQAAEAAQPAGTPLTTA